MISDISLSISTLSSKLFLVSVSFVVAAVSWGFLWSHMMGGDFWLGGILKLGFLSMASLLVDGVDKVRYWAVVKGVLSRLLGLHLCLLTVGLSGLLPFSFQGLVQLKGLVVAFGSIWLSLTLGFLYLRGSLKCVDMVVPMPYLPVSVVMVLVEVLSSVLLILVMPVRMGGNMLVGSVFLIMAGMLSILFWLGGGLLVGVILLEIAVVSVQSHVVSILFVEFLSMYSPNGRR
uniref:ATP synthase subunit 6 n=1 Tax=Pinctada maxima TaxID=104660 RepID=J9Q876_PINMA|nr:ATP synthase subunit 6 [Pinctada maxima]